MGTDNTARKELKDRLKNFKDSNCDKVFGSVIEGYSTKDFLNSPNNTEFYNVQKGNYANLTQNQVVGNGSQTRLGSSLGFGETAQTITGNLGTAVLLGPNFFSNTDATFQSNVLLHELLHAYTGGWSDAEIFSNFSAYGLTNPNGDSEDISAWLSTDCTKTPTSLTWWSGK